MTQVVYGQKGYLGSSMSVRAAEAYEQGEMPISRWTKTAIIQAVKGYCFDFDLAYDPDIEKKTKAELTKEFLEYKSWHHSSRTAREVEFFGIFTEHRKTVQCHIPAQIRKPVCVQLAFRRVLRQSCGSTRPLSLHGGLVCHDVEVHLLRGGRIESKIHEERVRKVVHIFCKVMACGLTAHESIDTKRMNGRLCTGRRAIGFADGACPHVEPHRHIVPFAERCGIFLDTPERQQATAYCCNRPV